MGDAGSLALGMRDRRAHRGAAPHLVPARCSGSCSSSRRRASSSTSPRSADSARRVLRASPIHHHFEELGLREQRLVVSLRRRRGSRHRDHRAVRARRGHGVVTREARGGDRRRTERPRLRDRRWRAKAHRVVLVDRSDTPGDPRAHRRPARAASRCASAATRTTSPRTRSWSARAPACPGTRPSSQVARAHGVPVRSEMDLVFERCRARICGITGTNGKTTTTALVAAILERAGERVHLGGNIGMTMLDRLDGVVRDRLGGPRALVVPDRVGARAALRDRLRAQRDTGSPRSPRRLRSVCGDQAPPGPVRAR